MTEEEAKGKWCPHARVQKDGRLDDGSPNRSDKTPNPAWSRCIGSACMAWRWDTSTVGTVRACEGYCGLAGRP